MNYKGYSILRNYGNYRIVVTPTFEILAPSIERAKNIIDTELI